MTSFHPIYAAQLRRPDVRKRRQIRDEYTRRNVELTDENERLSTENRRIRDELEAGTCAQLHELLARIDDLERNLVVVKQRRDSLKSKFEYVQRLLDNSRMRQLADWTSRGLDNSRSRRCCQKGKLSTQSRRWHPRVVQSATCPVRESSSPRVGNPRVGVSASCPVTRTARHRGAAGIDLSLM